MFVQSCVKGIAGRSDSEPAANGLTDVEARRILTGNKGIFCNRCRGSGTISPAKIHRKLTANNLARHIHDYAAFRTQTPFISLTAGCVGRDVALRLNRIHEAVDTALRFATDWGRRPGYLYFCWTIIGLQPAVAVPQVSEEVRDLNSHLSYSDYQLEGEVTAKIHIPASQIQRVEKWDVDGRGAVHATPTWTLVNPGFEQASQLSNLLEMI